MVMKKTKEQKNSIDIKVLSRLIAASNILYTYTCKDKTVQFALKTLKSIPSIDSVEFNSGNNGNSDSTTASLTLLSGTKMKNPKIYKTSLNGSGFLLFTVSNLDLFLLYKPFIESFINLIRLVLKKNEADKLISVKTKKVLEHCEEKYSLLMKQSPIDIEVYGMDGTMLQVNDAWEDLWQTKREYAVGIFNILKDPQVKEIGIFDYVKKAFEGEVQEIPEFEYDPGKAGFPGRARWLRSRVYPIKDSNGVVLNIVLTHEDVSDQKIKAKELEDLAKLPEENINPVYRVTKDGVLLYANTASRKMIMKDQVKIGYKLPEKWVKITKDVFSSGKLKILEVEFDGRIFLTKLVPLVERGYVNIYATDITERKKIEEELKRSQEQLTKAHVHTIYMLAIASEYKDPETGEHIKRIVQMTTELAVELGIEQKQAAQMGEDSLLHDLGKLGISDYILLKPGKLTVNEFETIKQHTVIGAKIIGDDEWFSSAREIALSHHERWDGNGYPEGLNGEVIPLAARIVAVADVFDALISKRPYKEPWPLDEAIEEIKRQAGKQFDPKVVAAFLSLHKKGNLKKL